MNLLINSEYGGYYYDLFYRLSFLICLLLFLFEGWRRRYPLSALLLMGATTIFFAILGSKASAISLEEWWAFLSQGTPLPLGGKSAVGALLFGWLGIGIAQRTLGFRRSVLDLYLLALPVTLIFQRLGCLMAGCCYGSPTGVPWAMSYGPPHLAWRTQHAEGLIDSMSTTSLTIHPVPVYFILAFLLCIVLVLRFRHRLRANGNKTLLVLILVFGFRFIIEFFRDPMTNHGWGETFWGIKQIQWLLLLLVLLFGTFLWLRESRYRPVVELGFFPIQKQLLRQLLLWSVPLMGLLLLPGWFSFSEMIIINAHIFFAALALAWKAFQELTHPRLRSLTAVLLVVALFSMGQTYQNLPVESKQLQPEILQSISFGFMEGRNTYGYDREGAVIPGTTKYDSDGCVRSAEHYTDYYTAGPYFTSVGGRFERLKRKNPELYKGIMLGGHLNTYNLRKNGVDTKRISEAGLLLGYSWMGPRYRVDIGGQIGRFQHLLGQPANTPVPMFHLRLGLKDVVFIEGGLGDDFPFGPTNSLWRLGGGLGLQAFNINHPASVQLGITNMGDDPVFYLSPNIPLGALELRPTFRFNKRDDVNNFGLILRWNMEEAPF